MVYDIREDKSENSYKYVRDACISEHTYMNLNASATEEMRSIFEVCLRGDINKSIVEQAVLFRK